MTLHSLQRWYRRITCFLWQSKTKDGLSTKEIFFYDVWLSKKLDKRPKLLLSDASKMEQQSISYYRAFFMNSWNRSKKTRATLTWTKLKITHPIHSSISYEQGDTVPQKENHRFGNHFTILWNCTVVKHRGIMINNTCKCFSLVIPHIKHNQRAVKCVLILQTRTSSNNRSIHLTSVSKRQWTARHTPTTQMASVLWLLRLSRWLTPMFVSSLVPR